MNRDDIIRLATEAGLLRSGEDWTMPLRWGVTEVERFAALVASVEREACAQLCYSYGPFDGTVSTEVKLARAIRARGQE